MIFSTKTIKPASVPRAWRLARKVMRAWDGYRRLRRLRGTAAEILNIGHVDSLELFDLIPDDQVSVIFDVGANRGTWTLLAKSYWPNATVIAFEPLRECQRLYLRATANLKDVTLLPVALGRETTEKPFFVTDNLDSSSLLKPLHLHEQLYGIACTSTETVHVVRACEIGSRFAVDVSPDLIKLDIQGTELDALIGFGDTLASVKHIIVEASFVRLYDHGVMAAELIGYLEGSGFRLISVSPPVERGSRIVQLDMLFSRQKLAG